MHNGKLHLFSLCTAKYDFAYQHSYRHYRLIRPSVFSLNFHDIGIGDGLNTKFGSQRDEKIRRQAGDAPASNFYTETFDTCSRQIFFGVDDVFVKMVCCGDFLRNCAS